MDYATMMGLIAGTLTTLSFVPQLVETWRTKSTKDLSIRWIVILWVGVFLWAVDGVLIDSIPVTATNLFTFVLVTFLLLLKIKYK